MVRADITIQIRWIIIQIPIERPCIRAIIRIPAENRDVPTRQQHRVTPILL